MPNTYFFFLPQEPDRTHGGQPKKMYLFTSRGVTLARFMLCVKNVGGWAELLDMVSGMEEACTKFMSEIDVLRKIYQGLKDEDATLDTIEAITVSMATLAITRIEEQDEDLKKRLRHPWGKMIAGTSRSAEETKQSAPPPVPAPAPAPSPPPPPSANLTAAWATRHMVPVSQGPNHQIHIPQVMGPPAQVSQL